MALFHSNVKQTPANQAINKITNNSPIKYENSPFKQAVNRAVGSVQNSFTNNPVLSTTNPGFTAVKAIGNALFGGNKQTQAPVNTPSVMPSSNKQTTVSTPSTTTNSSNSTGQYWSNPPVPQSTNNSGVMNNFNSGTSSPKGTPAYYADYLENKGNINPQEQALLDEQAKLRGQYSDKVAAPYSQFGIGEGQKRLSDYELARYNTQLTGINQQQEGLQNALTRGTSAGGTLLNAALPKTMGLTEVAYNPLEGATGNVAGNIGTRAQIAGNISSIQDLQQKRNAAATNLSSIGNIEGLMKKVLQNNNVNPSDVNAINAFTQRIAANTSSPEYQEFQQYLTSLKSLYADYLSRGGAITNASREESNQLLNGTASAETLLKGLGSLKNEANAYLSGYDTQVNNIVNATNQGQGNVSNNAQKPSKVVQTKVGNINTDW